MMTSKTLRKGFSFSEVMISLVMIGFLLTALLTLQSNVFRRVVINTFRIDRFYPLKNRMIMVMVQPLKKDELRSETYNEQMGLKIMYEQQPVKESSSLRRFGGLYQKRVVGTWLERDRERIQELIGYGCLFPEKKS